MLFPRVLILFTKFPNSCTHAEFIIWKMRNVENWQICQSPLGSQRITDTGKEDGYVHPVPWLTALTDLCCWAKKFLYLSKQVRLQCQQVHSKIITWQAWLCGQLIHSFTKKILLAVINLCYFTRSDSSFEYAVSAKAASVKMFACRAAVDGSKPLSERWHSCWQVGPATKCHTVRCFFPACESHPFCRYSISTSLPCWEPHIQ